MTRTLLIAGRGYLGRELERQASGAGWSTISLTKDGGEHSHRCDLSAPEQVSSLGSRLDLPPGTLSIIHCASSEQGGGGAYRAVFLEGCRNLLASFPAARLLFVSSSSVYGQTDGSLVTEDSPTEPERETSRILLESEALVLRSGGLVARLAGLYGPGRSVLLRRFLDGTARIEDEGHRFLNQIHRDDAARALLHLLLLDPARAQSVFNVSDSTPLRQIDCYRALATIFNRPIPPSGRPGQGGKRARTHKRVSNARLVSSGWVPLHPSFLDAAPGLGNTP